MSISADKTRALPATDPAVFHAEGYAVVRELFAADEVAQLRATAREAISELEATGRVAGDPGREGTIRSGAGDLLSNARLRHVLLDPRVLDVVEDLLGGKPVYFGDSSFRIGKNGVRGWHRDNVNRRRIRGGPDWHGPYPLLRCGIYLQDQSHHSGGLALRPRSSRPGRVRPTLPRLVDAHAGDLVAWNLRTVHSGEVVRLRGLPDLPLHPRLQTRVPDGLRVPDGSERIVMFMTFALPGPHLDNYIRYLKSRDYMCQAWSASRFGAEAWAEAEGAGLSVFAPIPAYGAPPEQSA
jgi:Phytanoyl-CoA dioxygenase (PhyH)